MFVHVKLIRSFAVSHAILIFQNDLSSYFLQHSVMLVKSSCQDERYTSHFPQIFISLIVLTWISVIKRA